MSVITILVIFFLISWKHDQNHSAIQISFRFCSERILEDHEYVLPTVLDWSRETENMLVFLNRRDKYMLFKNPQVCPANNSSTNGICARVSMNQSKYCNCRRAKKTKKKLIA